MDQTMTKEYTQRYTTSIMQVESGKNAGAFFIVGSVPATCTHTKPGYFEPVQCSNHYQSEEATIEAIMRDPFVLSKPGWRIQLTDYTVWTIEQIAEGEHLRRVPPLSPPQRYEQDIKESIRFIKSPVKVRIGRWGDERIEVHTIKGYKLTRKGNDTGLYIHHEVIPDNSIESGFKLGDRWVVTLESGLYIRGKWATSESLRRAKIVAYCVLKELDRAYINAATMTPDQAWGIDCMTIVSDIRAIEDGTK